jgi:hypothetical protein
MAPLPQQALQPTIAAIYAAWEAGANAGNRPHLGASVIGRECARALWFTFRWAKAPKHSGRLLRLFDRGQREEATFVAELRRAGVQVWEADPNTGRQFEYRAIGGHFGLSLDGVGLGFLEAPKTPHSIEMKTSSSKLFTKLAKEGVEQAKPEHYAQMQIGMHLSGLTRCFYIAVNKDNDELYSERVKYDEVFALRLLEKAKRIINANEPPERISDRPDWWQCQWCDFHDICHEQAIPEVNCRTCAHSTPELDGDQRWSCARYHCDLPTEVQRQGGECPAHVFIPALLPWKAVDADEQEGWIEYEKPDGSRVRNGLTETASGALR